MCSPAAAVGGGQMAIGLLGSYMAYKAAEEQAEEANQKKDERDARLKDKLVTEYGMGSQRIADLDKQKQQIEDIEQQDLMNEKLNIIRAEGRMEVAELAGGQSTELVKGQVVRESLMVEDQIKNNAGVEDLNISYQKRDVKTGLDIARFNTLDAIASTSYQSAPMKEMYMLQGLGSVASGASTYYSMPEPSRQSWFGEGGGGGGSTSKGAPNLSKSRYNLNTGSLRRTPRYTLPG